MRSPRFRFLLSVSLTCALALSARGVAPGLISAPLMVGIEAAVYLGGRSIRGVVQGQPVKVPGTRVTAEELTTV